MGDAMLAEWMNAQKLKLPSMTNSSVFYRNLEEALDFRRKHHGFYTLKNVPQRDAQIDFGSNDTLSLGASGVLRAEFMEELLRHPDIPIGSGASRVVSGNNDYLQTVEKELANFHGTEAGLILSSGFEANMAIFAAIPRPGDALVFDELVHASIHDGMRYSQATERVPFRHNDCDAFRDALVSISNSQPLVKHGKRCVLAVVESFYSMDGDICPLKDMLRIAKEVFPLGNCEFIVDEAHSIGVFGPNGSGLVCELGVEKEIAVRTHSFGKAIGGSGAAIYGSQTIKDTIVNLARPVVFTTAPPFTIVAATRAAYNLMKSGRTQNAQQQIQILGQRFLELFNESDVLAEAEDLGILSCPSIFECQEQGIFTPIVPLHTRDEESYWLAFHLQLAGISTYPVGYPVVPKGRSRLRVVLHAINTTEQIDLLVEWMSEWAQEMIQIERGGKRGKALPRAAKQVYAMMGASDSNGTNDVNGHTEDDRDVRSLSNRVAHL